MTFLSPKKTKILLFIICLVAAVIFGKKLEKKVTHLLYVKGIISTKHHNELHEQTSKFVLEDKSIEIPGLKNSFNPSLIRNGKEYFFCTRVDTLLRNAKLPNSNKIVGCRLDENLKFIENSKFDLDLKSDFPEDPRIFYSKGKTFILYNDSIPLEDSDYGRALFLAEVNFEEKKVVNIQSLNYSQNLVEKNWVPFVGKYNQEEFLLFQYSLNPYIVFRHQPFTPSVVTLPCDTSWDHLWGEIRGGTPPILLDDNTYIAFFHSSKEDRESKLKWYYMGAYTFSKNYPFKIKKISKRPIFNKSFYTADYCETTLPSTLNSTLKVVFPGGVESITYKENKEAFLIAYGSNDSACKYMILDKDKILSDLEDFEKTTCIIPNELNNLPQRNFKE